MNKERYSRHLLLDEIGEAGQQKLLDARVLLVGVGGLGSPIALYLAAAGVGTMGLIDPDVVSESNLQRQVLYTEGDVGKLKVECASQRLRALNGMLNVETYPFGLSEENAEEIIAGYDIVVDGCDNYATRYLMNDCCVAMGKPYVYGAIAEFHGQVCVFNLNGGLTYRDLYPNESELTAQPSKVLGVMGVVPGVIGIIQATQTIKAIVGCGVAVSNQLITINLLSMQTNVLTLDRVIKDQK